VVICLQLTFRIGKRSQEKQWHFKIIAKQKRYSFDITFFASNRRVFGGFSKTVEPKYIDIYVNSVAGTGSKHWNLRLGGGGCGALGSVGCGSIKVSATAMKEFWKEWRKQRGQWLDKTFCVLDNMLQKLLK